MARNPKKRGGGSDSVYKKEYCEMLIDHMSKGYSFGSFGADVSCGERTLANWADIHPEFAAAKVEGHARAKKYFETLANMKMRGLETNDFSAKKADTALIIFFLKTRFKEDYSERLGIDHTSNGKQLTLKYRIDETNPKPYIECNNYIKVNENGEEKTSEQQ